MRGLAGAMIFASFACAQNSPASEIREAVKSPITLARYVEAHSASLDWDGLWKALGASISDVERPRCGRGPMNSCTAEIISVLNPDQSILLIHGGELGLFDTYIRYLQTTGGAWRFSGEYSAFVKEYPRRSEVIRMDGKPFLKISSDASQIGIGYMQEMEDWFDLSQPGLEAVFEFTVQGSENRFGFGVGRRLTTVAVPLDANRIELVVNVDFVGVGLDVPETFTGTYTRPPAGSRFVLLSASSGLKRHSIPRKQFEQVTEIGSDLSNEQLLVYALPGLQKIARGSDADAKAWLRSILREAKDTSEKKLLLGLLGNGLGN